VLVSGLTDRAYNKPYGVESTPSPTTFRVAITEYVGPPELGTTPVAYLLSTSVMPDGIRSSIAQPATSRTSVRNCFFSNRLRLALQISSGILEFSGNTVQSAIGLFLFAVNNPLDATIGSNVFNCGWFIASQGNLISGQNRFRFVGTEIPARSAFVRFNTGIPWLTSEVVGRVKMVSNRAKPNNSQQRLFWMEYQLSNATVGSPTTHANNGTAWYAQTTTTLRNTTANRPTLGAIDVGQMYFDTTLDADGKPIWWTGTAWVDATGATV